MRIGACDICNAQNVEIAHGSVSGIETFYCAEGCNTWTCSACGRGQAGIVCQICGYRPFGKSEAVGDRDTRAASTERA